MACNGEYTGVATASVTGGAGNYTYKWSSGNTSDTATELPAGDHMLIVTDANGVVRASSVTIQQPGTLLFFPLSTEFK